MDSNSMEQDSMEDSQNDCSGEIKRRHFLEMGAIALPGVAVFPEAAEGRAAGSIRREERPGRVPMIGKIAFQYNSLSEEYLEGKSASLVDEESFYSKYDSLKLGSEASVKVNTSKTPINRYDDLQYYVNSIHSNGSIRITIGSEYIKLDNRTGKITVGSGSATNSKPLNSEGIQRGWYRIYVERNKNKSNNVQLYNWDNNLVAEVEGRLENRKSVQSAILSATDGSWIISPILGPSINKKYLRQRKKHGHRSYPEITSEEKDSKTEFTVFENFNNRNKFKLKGVVYNDGTYVANSPWGTYLGRLVGYEEDTKINQDSGGFPSNLPEGR